jgi:pimeloyl-ACP methyl ester carboxylesterase
MTSIDATGTNNPSMEWIPTSGGHELSLQNLPPEGTAPTNPATVLLLHGLFSDARFFWSGGKGPARYFLDQGYHVLLGELRGHGKSRRPASRPWDFSFDAYAQHDVPDLVRAARSRSRGPLFLVCHSMTGYAALAGIGLNPDVQDALAGVCTLSSAVNDYTDGGLKKQLLVRFSSLLGSALGYFPARRLRQGPSDEPGRLMKQFAAWAADGSFASEDRATDYWKALGRVTLPVLAGIGEADVFHASPRRGKKLVDALGSARKEFVVVGTSHGFARDYGHADILRSSKAATEVLPLLHTFMQSVLPR